ncbi:hypothetical protein COU57_03400 [Candidatus Pacearchaeota archaeon CG10_big_fil_rev_8_21_14_0_10_32_14]|nr:MAG: hypothetical protein COU57_03400 [Candidatus Pacearchaeota archaeon CG10_big_fil_rev_8_21_14_0_10_32_14]
MFFILNQNPFKLILLKNLMSYSESGFYHLGFDVGTERVHSALIDEEGALSRVYPSRNHFGNPSSVINDVLNDARENGLEEKLRISFTGSGGEIFADSTNSTFFHDTVTIPSGASYLSPSASYVFHIGAKDPYFFETSSINLNEKLRLYIPDSSTGTKCGGGSGMLITKQCRRFFENEVPFEVDPQAHIELMYQKAYELAIQADKELDVGGRCGVVIQSDMIHLQNSGEQIKNIIRGMFERVARNYKTDVIRVRSLDPEKLGVMTGGVASNEYILRMLRKHLDLPIELSPYHSSVGAIGAALKSRESGSSSIFISSGLDTILKSEKEGISYVEPLSSVLSKINIVDDIDDFEKYKNLSISRSRFSNLLNPQVVMGVDGGSTTTKTVVLSAENLETIASGITSTHGKPLEAAQLLFGQMREVFKDSVDIRAVAYTGSSGSFYHKLFTKPSNNGHASMDLIKDEITCHAYGVKHFRQDVDTIFELGGQDAKFTVFNNGSVKKSKMNLSCMAGTGQTMENMMKMIGLNYDTFEEYALRATRTPVVDDTCGVFTEAAIAKLITLGLPKEEIAAAIAYGFIGGYVNKFVGNESTGNCISAQGGPFNNRACLAALALHTNKQINAFPHRQLFGAYGAALIAHQSLQESLKE